MQAASQGSYSLDTSTPSAIWQPRMSPDVSKYAQRSSGLEKNVSVSEGRSRHLPPHSAPPSPALFPGHFQVQSMERTFPHPPLLGCKTAGTDSGQHQANHPETGSPAGQAGSLDAVLTPLSYRGRATAVAGEDGAPFLLCH